MGRKGGGGWGGGGLRLSKSRKVGQLSGENEVLMHIYL